MLVKKIFLVTKQNLSGSTGSRKDAEMIGAKLHIEN